jgi:hypothetical protein
LPGNSKKSHYEPRTCPERVEGLRGVVIDELE